MNKKFLSIQIDAKSALPVYEQVKRAIKLAIFSGQLEEGDKLMSIRELALKLQVNPNTIIKVYYQLEVEGFIYSKPGTGYFVKLNPKKIKKEKVNLFREITSEYIAKALALGYSFEDMKKEISEKISDVNPKKSGGED